MPLYISQPLSLYSTPIKMMLKETDYELAIATGFFYKHNNQYYLITNGHCITGSNWETQRKISKIHSGFPDLLRTNLKIMRQDPPSDELVAERVEVLLRTLNIELYRDDYQTKPTWYIHPQHGYNVDVVAIPINTSNEFLKDRLSFSSINRYLNSSRRPRVADDIYILGYPFGITDVFEFPIWKRASIASEPNIDYEGLPKMLVDTATRSGMSGSPVLQMRPIIHSPNDKFRYWQEPYGDNNDLIKSEVCGFLGVYSGRIGDKTDAQLGIVWRKEVIEEILEAKVPGTIEFQSWPCSE